MNGTSLAARLSAITTGQHTGEADGPVRADLEGRTRMARGAVGTVRREYGAVGHGILPEREGSGPGCPGGTREDGPIKKPLRGGEVSRRHLLGLSRIVPVAGLAVPPCRRSAGWRARRWARSLGASRDTYGHFLPDAWMGVNGEGAGWPRSASGSGFRCRRGATGPRRSSGAAGASRAAATRSRSAKACAIVRRAASSKAIWGWPGWGRVVRLGCS
jgi:hypothetical protein